MNLQIVLPQFVSMADYDNMYGFDAFTIAKSAGMNRYAKLFRNLFLHITN
jgi:hypothetical protein